MKRMKRTLVLFAALAALLSLSAPALAAYTTENDRTVLLDCNEEFLVKTHYNGDAGGEVPDEQVFLLTRIEAFSYAYDCDIYVGCMSSPVWLGAGSFEDYQVDFFAKYPDALGENAVCLLYDQESGGNLVHVGSAVAQNCDTSPVTAALLEEEGGNYARMVNTLNALQAAIGRPRTYLLYCQQPEHYDRIQKSLSPLREKFTGMVYVCYEYTGADEEVYKRQSDVYASTYTMYRMENFYSDAICIFYYGNTGDTFIQIGDGLDLHVEDMDTVEAMFTATPGPRNYIGFSNGVQALADNLSSGRDIPAYAAPLIVVVAVVILALAMGIEVLARKKGRPLTAAPAEK